MKAESAVFAAAQAPMTLFGLPRPGSRSRPVGGGGDGGLLRRRVGAVVPARALAVFAVCGFRCVGQPPRPAFRDRGRRRPGPARTPDAGVDRRSRRGRRGGSIVIGAWAASGGWRWGGGAGGSGGAAPGARRHRRRLAVRGVGRPGGGRRAHRAHQERGLSASPPCAACYDAKVPAAQRALLRRRSERDLGRLGWNCDCSSRASALDICADRRRARDQRGGTAGAAACRRVDGFWSCRAGAAALVAAIDKIAAA